MSVQSVHPHQITAWLQPEPMQPFPQRALLLWMALRDELSPLLGASGFDALFARCIYISAERYPWLAPPAGSLSPGPGFDALAGHLGSALAGQHGAEALAASQTLFAEFHVVLLSLIGEALTAGVLDAVWSALLGQRAPPPHRDHPT